MLHEISSDCFPTKICCTTERECHPATVTHLPPYKRLSYSNKTKAISDCYAVTFLIYYWWRTVTVERLWGELIHFHYCSLYLHFAVPACCVQCLVKVVCYRNSWCRITSLSHTKYNSMFFILVHCDEGISDVLLLILYAFKWLLFCSCDI